MDNRVIKLAGLSFIVLGALAGCASTPEPVPAAATPETAQPVSALDAARTEVREAEAAGYQVDDANIFLRKAEQAAAAGDDEASAGLAGQARHAVEARKAIEAARPVVTKAMAEAGPLASDAGKLLEAAEAALKAGDPVRATELAAQARRQADGAMEQHRAELVQAANERASRYQVVRGDTLWTVSGKSRVYGDPLLWPLLFRSNRDRIKDPDVIFPGQALAIERNPAPADRQAAVRHARTRGAWKAGVTEASDTAYLAR